jgi:Holliday junction resolvase RusA-like endonuclease
MKPSINFHTNCIPIAQPRQRHSFVNGIARNYIPEIHPVTAFKKAIQLQAMATRQTKELIDYPVKLILDFVFPRPKNMIWKKKEMYSIPKASKPDFDNLAKSVCDALNGILWVDDSLVCKADITKRIASGSETPHVYIGISEYVPERYIDSNNYCEYCNYYNDLHFCPEKEDCNGKFFNGRKLLK